MCVKLDRLSAVVKEVVGIIDKNFNCHNREIEKFHKSISKLVVVDMGLVKATEMLKKEIDDLYSQISYLKLEMTKNEMP